MSIAPSSPECRHCGATNDPGASECWLCHRRDWRGPSEKPSGQRRSRPPSDARGTFTGCLILIIAILCTAVGLAFRAGPYLGLLVLVPSLAILALAIALFAICMAL